ncbi:unnamed protein product [Penicillium viridicatum]
MLASRMPGALSDESELESSLFTVIWLAGCCSLFFLLNALTIHFRRSSTWTLHRKAFIATFQNAKFQARTDGYLEGPRGNAMVIIEVKPVLGSLHLLPIQMQESAQMVVWIKSDSKLAQESNTMCKIDALLITVYEDLKARGWLEDDPKVILQFETALKWGRLPIRTNYTSVSAKPTTYQIPLVRTSSELVVNRPPDGRSSGWDDFAIDESGNAYVAQPANSIVKIAPGGAQSVSGGGGHSLAFIGPTSVQIVPVGG